MSGLFHAELFIERDRWSIHKISLYKNDISIPPDSFFTQAVNHRGGHAATPAPVPISAPKKPRARRPSPSAAPLALHI